MTGRRRSVLDVLRSAARIVLAVWCVVSPSFAQQTPRDGRKPPGVGTAAITGVILLDDAQPKPLRRARVMLNGPKLTVGRTVITNEDGTFAIDRLPAGRYTVGAVKDGYVAMMYGARRPGRGGTGITLRDGETRSIALRLPRGGVITGTVTDADGQPASGISVNALSYGYVVGGERRLGSAGISASATDDRGVYRVFGLPAGDYSVAAQGHPVGPTTGDLQMLSQSEVRQALAVVRETVTRAQPGSSTPSAPSAPASNEPRRNVTLAPVFYPGTSDAANAARIAIAAGEERGGVDFQLQYVPTATVSGIVSMPAGATPPSVNIVRSGESLPFGQNVRSTRADADGRFTVAGVAPGRYTVMAQSFVQAPRASGSSASAERVTQWAATEIIVDGQDIAGIGLTLQLGLTIAGRLVFEGTRQPPPDLSTLRITAPMAMSANLAIPLPPVQLESGGRFTISGIVPGPYRLIRAMQGVRTPLGGWWLKSIVINGREMLDAELDLRQSTVDAVVTFSDRATELSGRVTDSRGNATPEHFVIAFGADRAAWFFNSRRVAGVRPDVAGRYTIRNLPPGEYLVARSDDLESNEWYDPSLLERLARSATRLVIGDYETKTYDIRIP